MKLKPYPKYQDSGIEWIGDIPEEWEVKKIKHVSNVRISNVDKKSKPNEPEVLLCNYTDVYSNEFIDSRIEFMEATASYEQIRKLSLRKEDVIITKDSEDPEDIAVPSVVVDNIDAVCGYHLALIKPDKTQINGNFLFRSLQSKGINTQFVIWALGVTRFGISTYPIKNSYLLLPSIEEQEKIASFLNKKCQQIDHTIKKDKQLIELLSEKRTSLINHVVTKSLDTNLKIRDSGIEWIGEIPEGWEVHKLKYRANINKEKLDDDTSPTFKINYLDISNVDSQGNVNEIEEQFFEDAPSRARRIPQKKDTIISTVRTYLKAVAYLKEIPENLIVSTGFAVLNPSKSIYPKYLFYAVRSEKFIQSVIAVSKGVAYPAINPPELGQLRLIIPPYDEQKDIAEYLDRITTKIDGTIQKIERKIELLEEHKKSLIHYVITGKIDVRSVAA